MSGLLLICAGLLFLSIVDLPIGYYTFLRIVVFAGALAVGLTELKLGLNIWVITFGIIGIIFNPILPVYLNDKDAWIPIDILAGVLFTLKSILLTNPKK